MVKDKQTQIDALTKTTAMSEIKKIDGFTKQMRSIESTSLETGDEFTIPQKPEVYSMTVGSGTAEFIVVETKNGICKRFFPSVFQKNGVVLGKVGIITGERVASSVKVCEDARNCQTVAEAMKKLGGKKLKVTNVNYVRISSRFDSRGYTDTGFPVIEYV